ncbi:Calx-beta domain-containing protein [Anabaenopsis arnoldii]|uniref:VWD domain-containing protein n=1 Tax=Anabaenopsis arnoldii TaxID=2152938 RepID=A0ABT5ATQ1_9CYAN|nr:RHS repeat-associated core domain-containing protein [Anabaenopsis arnoldii]MDB9540082.1 VWD domain-containing protein [Anabaenopsis arnoldii]MDH6092442.1 VWD domain-containing protein [Anabaenopsis arnoldii]
MRTIQTAPGDGGLEVTVDELGRFGSSGVGGQAGVYDPVGSIGPASTTYLSFIALGIIAGDGTTGQRIELALSQTNDEAFTSSTDTTANSAFTINGLQFQLEQIVQDSFNREGEVRTGARLDQVYSITNITDQPIRFDLVRYVDGDLNFDGSLIDGGGRIIQRGVEIIFETDAGGTGETDTTFFGITGTGGTIPTTNRWEIDGYSSLRSNVLGGSNLQNIIVQGDSNSDGFVDRDSEYDLALALRNVFELAPGASTTYITTTRFGSGEPEQLDITPPSGGVSALPPRTVGNSINVTWGATDRSGIRNYDVFVSVDGGVFTPWLTNVTINNAIYTGETGKTYTFYSLATDNLGNRQVAATALRTSTQIINPIPGTLSFSAPQFTVNEDGTPVTTVTVTRTGGSDGVVSATINFKDGTAKAPNDYNNTTITVNFADGQTIKAVNIPIVNDNISELDETIQLSLTTPTGGATIGKQNTAPLTIIDDDGLAISGFPRGAIGSNQGQTTIIIVGQKFSPTDKVSLVATDGSEKEATKVYWVNDNETWATFDLQGLTPGRYNVEISDGVKTAAANSAFTVTNNLPGNLRVQLSYPSSGVAIVTYTNVGQTDVIAPLLRIVPTNAQVNYPEDNTVSATLRQLLNLSLATGGNGPVGILTPGQTEQFSFTYTPSGNGLISFTVEQVQPDEIINWASIKAESRADYSFINDAAWDAIWSNLTAVFGTTAGQFQAVMAENANYLSQLGQPTNNLNRLFAFEWIQAVNTLTNVSLISSTDVVDAAPGLSLTFNRTFYQSIAERYNLGALGRGWASEWDLRATTDNQGNVVIRSVGDLQRAFEQQTDGSYTEAGGAVVTIVNGEYRLREVNGIVSLFNRDGQLSYVEDPNGNRITLEYADNRLTQLVHTNGDTLTLDYNPQGRISQITDSTGQVTNYTYDTTGEALLSVTSDQGTIAYTYDTSDVAGKKYSLLSVTSELGYQRNFEYDNQGRLIREYTNEEGLSLTYSYDSVGGVTITDSTGTSQTILLDDRGNGAQIRGVNNQNLLFRYDADGNLISATLPNGGQSSYSYDSTGNLSRQTNLLNQNVNFTYDSTFNQLTGFTDPRGNSVNYTYDDRGNLTLITYPDGSREQFIIDDLGNLTSFVNRRGNGIQYTYNQDGLLTAKQYPDGSGVSYIYDTRGNLTTVTDATGSITMEYDGADQVTKVTYPTGRTLSYTYNADGQRTRLVSQDGYTVNYGYDNLGRLKTLTDVTGQGIISYDYDILGRLIKETNGNGTYTTYEYNQESQLSRLINYKADNAVNSRFEYSYDNLGRRITMTTLEGIFQYGYDAVGQLTSVVTPDNRTINYTYDGAGNRIAVTDSGITTGYSSNNLNQYTRVGNAVYTYDRDGNLIQKNEGGQTTTYTYDVENRLVEVETADGSRWEYEYDGLGNRVATIINGQRTEYLLDPAGLGDIVGEYDGNGNLVTVYHHGIGLVSRVSDSNSYYYDADALGSTIGLTTNDGSYVNRYSYLPFGEDLTKVEGVANPFEYVGQWGVMDEGNGLDFMRARFYDSGLGRFTAVDPIGLNAGDANFYRYVFNNPVSYTDPSGLLAPVPLIAAGAVLGGISNAGIYAVSSTIAGNFTLSGLAGAGISGAAFGAGATLIAASGATGLVANSLSVGLGGVTGALGYVIENGTGVTVEGLGSAIAIGAVGGLIPSVSGFKGKGVAGFGKQPSITFNRTVRGLNRSGLALGKGLSAGNLFNNVVGQLLGELLGRLKGGTWNDPHLDTLDGLGYDFQAVGEFTLVKSTTDELEIQTRQQPWGNSTSVSINTAIAIKLGDQRIAIYANQAEPLLINGTTVTLPNSAVYAVGQNLITREGNQYRIITANNDLIQVKHNGSFLNINLGLADNRQGKVVGLLGNFNNNRNDEFNLRDGTVIGGSISNEQLYGDYGNSWRIVQGESLFDYAPGQDTNTFTDLTYPRNIVTAATLTPEQRAAAEQIARDAGITDPDILEDVILDIFITNGDLQFIQGAVTEQRLTTVSAPNTLVNPDGFGTEHYLTAGAIIPYTIRFSNNAEAETTPVAQVTISQQLDTDLDFNTFTLNNLGFGDITLVTNGVQNYNQRLDLRDTRGVFVDVNAGLDVATGIVTWTFTAIDPLTGNPVDNTTQGFLPPNDSNGAGRGFVSYSIQPLSNITNNTRIDAQGSITFNNQTPLLTNPVFNTLDSDIPVSQVNPLPANSNEPNFTVSWTGTDNGSGIASYDIYVAIDNGDFTIWQQGITQTSAIYNGEVGRTYAFYSLAQDNLGLTEVIPTQADTSITVDRMEALQVNNFQTNSSGFVLTFNDDVNLSVLNLYTGLDLANPLAPVTDLPDLTLTDSEGNIINGSLIWDETDNALTFVKTGDILAPGNYTLTLESRSDGFVSTNGRLLDGNEDGFPGGNFVREFTVNSPTVPVLTLPDFSRAPGQEVNIRGGGQFNPLPIRITNPGGVDNISFTLQYDPDLLAITGANVVASGWNLNSDFNTPGQAQFTLSGPALNASTDLITLNAQLQQTATYGAKGVLQILPGAGLVGDSAVQLVALVGDTTKTEGYLSTDAALISRVNVGLDSGFRAFPVTDPLIIGDATNNGIIDAADATSVRRASVGLLSPFLPQLVV